MKAGQLKYRQVFAEVFLTSRSHIYSLGNRISDPELQNRDLFAGNRTLTLEIG